MPDAPYSRNNRQDPRTGIAHGSGANLRHHAARRRPDGGHVLSVEDKILIAAKLDELGWTASRADSPARNPRRRVLRSCPQPEPQARQGRRLRRRRGARGLKPKADPNLQALVDAQTPAICFVGKASDFQVRTILETTPEENLAMIADSVRYMKSLGKAVYFDAEHFFDGFFDNPDYSIQLPAGGRARGRRRSRPLRHQRRHDHYPLAGRDRSRAASRTRRWDPRPRRRRPGRRQYARGRGRRRGARCRAVSTAMASAAATRIS